MKLSGHTYSNDVFNSLLDGISKDVMVKTAAKHASPTIDLNFSETTSDTFQNILDEELSFIAKELAFAAKTANVEVTPEDLKKFAADSKSLGLRGKKLEKAARHFCNQKHKYSFAPLGITRIASADELIQSAKNSTILPSGFPEDQRGNSATGGYMGMSKNPNTIWNSDALTKLASKPENHLDKMGDERIRESKESKEASALEKKTEYWQNLQNMLSDGVNITNKIVNASTIEKGSFNPKVGTNHMSIFSDDQDFKGIPEKTTGEMLKESAENRETKSATSKNEWNKISSSKKVSNNLDFVFSKKQDQSGQTSTQRAATDSLFDGLIKNLPQ